MEKSKKFAVRSAVFLALFAVFTVLVMKADTAPSGVNGTDIGFSRVNLAVAGLLKYSAFWHRAADLIGYFAIMVCAFFGAVGAVQLFKKKDIRKVHYRILLLGAFYILVILLYIVFNNVVINYRPLILPGDAAPEPSYPSSHTMLAVCVFITAAYQLRFAGDGFKGLAKTIRTLLYAFTGVMVISRILSGVHWITDIIGALLISASLIYLFMASVEYVRARRRKR